jgi:UDP-glucose 4-epimerase
VKILVTGGAGYIGSHMVRDLQASGHEVVALDSLERGHAASISCPLVQVDLRDKAATRRAIEGQGFDGVIHFAAFAAAGESVEKPGLYFENNVGGTANLLDAMVAADVNLLVFSSSCGIYGQPERLPVAEDALFRPESPYGASKAICEQMLPWYERPNGIHTVSLRYFNACGASLDGSIGDDARPVTRLIPNAMKAALGRREGLTIFGNDYSTPDGTCVRDYIHVLDLTSAHLLALEYLADGGKTTSYNVGVGVGYSNRELVDAIKRITGVDFPVQIGPRRPGDPATSYADNSKIRRGLGWEPRYSDLETIVRTDWLWHSQHPDGYGDH